jgi:hypothetical protein
MESLVTLALTGTECITNRQIFFFMYIDTITEMISYRIFKFCYQNSIILKQSCVGFCVIRYCPSPNDYWSSICCWDILNRYLPAPIYHLAKALRSNTVRLAKLSISMISTWWVIENENDLIIIYIDTHFILFGTLCY